MDQQATVISTAGPLPVAADGAEASPPSPARIAPGTRLGHFELLECVGGGGMGRVYRATDTLLARTVAVKVLSRDQAADDEALLRFRNEAQSAARLNHENIVQVYHVGDEEGQPYIVFEFIEGRNLRAIVEERGALSLGEALSYTFQVAEALAHAAERGVVHRDIKPSNVLVTKGGRVKLIDMGLARIQHGDPADDLTASGVTLGTFDYISPEQARDPRTADVRSDIYSLGCTLFFILAGQPPFPVGTVLQKLLQHQGEEPPDVRQFRPDLPEEVSRLLRRMMAKDPRRRFQTPLELIAAMVRLTEQAGLRLAGPGEAMWVPRQSRPLSYLQRHAPWIVPVGLLLAAVVVLDLLWSGPQAGDRAIVRSPVARVEQADLESKQGDNYPPWDDESWDEKTPPDAAEAKPADKTSSGGEKEGPGKTAQPMLGPPDPAAKAAGAGDPPAGEKPAEPAKLLPKESPGSDFKAGESIRAASLEGELKVAGPGSSGAVAAPPLAPGGQSDTASSAGKPGVKPPEPTGNAPRPGVLVVDGVGGAENRFATLAAACSKAANGDVIELRFNGRREEFERPCLLTNLKVTIHAADRFQPVIAFRPADPDPVKCPRTMLTLAGSQLTVVNVAFELDIPREVFADSWSLVELRQGAGIRLERCSLTVRNASDGQTTFFPDVAFFRIRSDPGTGPPLPDGPVAPAQRAAISLVDCIVRGEAMFLRIQDTTPIRLAWDNGLLATTEPLLVADAGERMPGPGNGIELNLEHLTAAVRGGLCRLQQTEAASYPSPVTIGCTDNIFLGTPSTPLLEQAGVPAKDSAERGVQWTGDRNFYEVFSVFWSIRRSGPDAPPEAKTFEAWRAHWGPQRELLPSSNRVQWRKLPPADKPMHQHTAADYALTKPSEGTPANPAAGAASDGADAGMTADRLPPLPPPAIVKTPPAEAGPEKAKE